jgi:WD40 repeat protein
MGSTINISSDGQNLILTSWTDTSVRVWDPKAQKVVEKFDDLVGAVAALRYNGKVVIAEHGKNRVFAPGDGTVFAADLSAPTGLVIHGEDLFVSDYTDGVVLRIARNGIPLVEPETVVTGLSAPEGFVVDDKGYVVVESDIGQITRIGHDGVRTLLGKISPGSIAASEAQPPSMVFNGITQTSAGVYFLAVEKSRTLLKLAM